MDLKGANRAKNITVLFNERIPLTYFNELFDEFERFLEVNFDRGKAPINIHKELPLNHVKYLSILVQIAISHLIAAIVNLMHQVHSKSRNL